MNSKLRNVLKCAGWFAFYFLASPVGAQSLKQTGVTIFTAIYEVVGVVGAIAILCTALNWKLNLFGNDPKKYFINASIGTGIAFGVPTFVLFIKEMTKSSSGISGL